VQQVRTRRLGQRGDGHDQLGEVQLPSVVRLLLTQARLALRRTPADLGVDPDVEVVEVDDYGPVHQRVGGHELELAPPA